MAIFVGESSKPSGTFVFISFVGLLHFSHNLIELGNRGSTAGHVGPNVFCFSVDVQPRRAGAGLCSLLPVWQPVTKFYYLRGGRCTPLAGGCVHSHYWGGRRQVLVRANVVPKGWRFGTKVLLKVCRSKIHRDGSIPL